MSRWCWKEIALAGLLAGLFVPGMGMAQEAESEGGSVFRFLVSWLPILVIIGLWIFFMKRLSTSPIYRSHTQRSYEHMDRVEKQNEEMLELLRGIQRSLAGGG